jgi:hypothetical protein
LIPAKHVLAILLLTVGAAAQVGPPQNQQQGQPQTPGGTLPDAPSATVQSTKQATATPSEAAPYVPLTNHQKLVRWEHYTYSPYTFTSVLLSAGWSQAMGNWPSYGGGMEGFGKRFGATLANTETSGFFKTFLLPTLLHTDPRYFRSAKTGVGQRIWYSATRVFVVRNDKGKDVFNTSEVLGSGLSAGVTNSYYPRQDRSFGQTMSTFGGTLLSDAGSNVLREFWPDIRRIFRKHEPEKMKKIEKKIPKRVGDAVGKTAGGENE